MENRKINWLIYTVLVGLIPVICRTLVWLVTKPGTIDFLSPPDFISFGLVLHISNINEVEHFNDIEKDWKTIQNGTSIAFIALYSVLFSLTLIANKVVNTEAITGCTIALSVVSFLLSYSVYDRAAKLMERTQ